MGELREHTVVFRWKYMEG